MRESSLKSYILLFFDLSLDEPVGIKIKNARFKRNDVGKIGRTAGISLCHNIRIENNGSFPSYEVLYKLICELQLDSQSK